MATLATGVSAWLPRPMLFELGWGVWPLWRLRAPDVALTFDDGPDPRQTPLLLDALALHAIPATFFVSSSLARRYPELVRRTRAEGHTVGCHGMAHRPLAFRRRRTLDGEISGAVEALEDVLGETVAWFRPPYGIRSPGTYRAMRRAGVRPVFWNVIAYDWRRPAPGLITHRVCRTAGPGSIILLHDGGGDRRSTIEAVPTIADQLRGRNLRVMTLDAGGFRHPFTGQGVDSSAR